MSVTVNARSSATILVFPPRGREAATDWARRVDAVGQAGPRPVCAASGDAWYHEAAIRDERERKPSVSS